MSTAVTAKVWITKSDDVSEKDAKSKSKQVKESSEGLIAPPVAYDKLIRAYYSNAYHASSIDVKAINILGNGLEDETVNKKLQEMSVGCSLHVLLEKTIKDFLLFGNAFWELAGNQIFHIPAWTMYRNSEGWLMKVEDRKVQYSLEDIWHFKADSLTSSFYGSVSYIPILPAIELMSSIWNYNKNFFKNNAIPDFAIIVEGGVLSPDAEYNISQFLRTNFGGEENAHKALYLPTPEGVKINFEKMQVDRDMQFEKQDESCISQIIACHGVPPRLLGIHVQGKLGGASESTGEMEIFYRTRIAPLQNMFGGYLDSFFQERLGMKTDITFDSFNYEEDVASQVLSYMRG